MPNQGVPVIFKNKIAYGYAEKSVQAYDVSVSDYNALTEQQQLDGSIRFIQGVNAIPNGNNVWAKLGTTPLAEGLPRDCSQAVNELKSNLTDYVKYEIKNTDRLSTNIETGGNTQYVTNYYSIRNGICEFNVSIVARATISNASTPVINLPTPRMANTLNLGDWIDFNTNTRTGAVLQGGILYIRYITNGTGYSIFGRYEVDPSWSPST